MRFTIRDLCWVTLLVAAMLGWWRSDRQLRLLIVAWRDLEGTAKCHYGADCRFGLDCNHCVRGKCKCCPQPCHCDLRIDQIYAPRPNPEGAADRAIDDFWRRQEAGR